MNMLEEALRLAAETRRVLNYHPPMGVPVMSRSTAISVKNDATPAPKRYDQLSFLERARLKQQDPKGFAVAKAAHIARRQKVLADIAAPRSHEHVRSAYAALRELDGRDGR
jgi:hypothetical protein